MFSMSLKFVVIEQRRKLHNWIPPTKTAEKTNQTHKRPSHKRIRPCKIQNPNIQKPSTRAIQPFNELGFPSKQKTKKPICGMCVWVMNEREMDSFCLLCLLYLSGFPWLKAKLELTIIATQKAMKRMRNTKSLHFLLCFMIPLPISPSPLLLGHLPMIAPNGPPISLTSKSLSLSLYIYIYVYIPLYASAPKTRE